MSSRCQKPIMLRNSVTYSGEERPCGKCINCKKRFVSNWSFRLMQEDKVSASAYFVTLTYDTDNCPITKNGFMDLRKRDLQLFFKRLRKCQDGTKPDIKYYAVGEYGGRLFRPHYHIILFNAGLETLIGKKFSAQVERGNIELDGKRPFICDSWCTDGRKNDSKPIGHITVGRVSGASVGYTMKYVTKDWRIPLHRNDDREPEFSLKSNGLGISYLTPAMIRWHMSNFEKKQFVMLADGKKASLPKYYRDKLLTQDERDTYNLFMAEYRKCREDLVKVEYENTARERSEAYYHGLDKMKNQSRKNQTF